MRSSIALAGTAAVASAITLDVSGYNRQSLGYAAINAPVTDQCYTYIQHSTYSDITDAANFDPARCIRDCEETTAYNKQYLNGRASCRFVNTYILLKDGYSQGQICSMYTATWDASYATNTGYTDDGHVYSICDSYSYSNITDPGVPGQDCVGGPYKPQPPVDPTSTVIPTYPSSTQIPSYPSSTFSTVSIPTTTSQPTIIIPTSTFSTVSIPTTTSKTVVIPSSTFSTISIPTTPSLPTTTSAPTVVLPTTTVPVVVPTTSAGSDDGGLFRCSGLLSSPQCCQTNVLDAASLTCNLAPDFTTRSDFRAVCAATGATASCCLLPVLGQGLVCQDV